MVRRNQFNIALTDHEVVAWRGAAAKLGVSIAGLARLCVARELPQLLQEPTPQPASPATPAHDPPKEVPDDTQ